LPIELLVQVAARRERLGQHHYVEVVNLLELDVTLRVGILLDDNDTLAKDVFIHLAPSLLRNENHFSG